MTTSRIRVTGHVQGVGLRWWCQRRAREVGVLGYVENKRDGSVDIVCQAEHTRIDAFLNQLKKEWEFGRGSSVTSEIIPNRESFTDFTIHYS